MDQRPSLKPEMDFGDLLRQPRKLFGYSYIYFLAVFVVIGALYVNRLDAVGRNSVTPVVLKDSSAFILEIPFQSPMVLPPVDVRTAAVPGDSAIARGKELYRTACASCHGDNGQGDGPAGIALNPKPRNFHVAEGWTNGARIVDIYRTLQDGIVKNGMASYAYMPPADRFALIHVIRSYHPAPPMDAVADIDGLETVYQLSKGSVMAAQVPVRVAEGILVKERAPARDAVGRALAHLRTGGHPGAAVFLRETDDPVRALTACAAGRIRNGGLEQFINAVSADPVALGFRAGVVRLPRDQWAAMHQALLQELE